MGSHHHQHAQSTSSVKSIGFAFALNFFFAVVELVGGFWAGSLAILADAVHDFGDSLTLLFSLILEKLAARGRTKTFTYGYRRFSLLAAVISGIVIATGSGLILLKSFPRLLNPPEEPPFGLGMLGLAVLGIVINGIAAFRLKAGKTRNEKVLTWHLVEDLLGWVAVLIGALTITFTHWTWVDPLLAILVAGFVIFNVMKNLIITLKLFLQGVPEDFDEKEFINKVQSIHGIKNVHDVHAWSLDGERTVVSCHIVVSPELTSFEDQVKLKKEIQETINHEGKTHLTIDLEPSKEKCVNNCEEKNLE